MQTFPYITDLPYYKANPTEFRLLMRKRKYRRINLAILETAIFMQIQRSANLKLTYYSFIAICSQLGLYDSLIELFWIKWERELLIMHNNQYSFRTNDLFVKLTLQSHYTIKDFVENIL